MEEELAGGTQASFDNAKKIYMEGGNSKTVATLTVAALDSSIKKGTKLTAQNSLGSDVVGTANSDAAAGDTSIEFKYPVSTITEDHLDCRVGGLPLDEQVTKGCK